MITQHHRSRSNQVLTPQNHYRQADVDSRPKKMRMTLLGMRTSMLRLTVLPQRLLSCCQSSPNNGLGRIKIASLSRWGERLVTLIVGAIVFTWLPRHTQEGCNGGPYMAEQEVSPKNGNDGGDPYDASPRVAVCFFGLTRSLRWTLPSVEKRLFDVLRQEGHTYDVFLHTYDVMEVQ